MVTAGTLFWIIIAVVCFNYLFNLWLGILNTRSWSNVLPEKLKGIYDEERYRLQQQYEKENYRLGLISGFLSFDLMILVLATGSLGILDNFVRWQSASPVLQGVYFFGIVALGTSILSIPFDLYDTFVIEEKYGFNKTTPRTYFLDTVKSWLLAAVIGGGLLAFIIFLYQETGKYFWILAWLVVTFFSLFISYFYTTLLIPIFNKLSPLPEGELSESIRQYATRAGYQLQGVFIIDGSKRSSKGNAFFSGFGTRKKVVLYDTLMASHPADELVAVLAHEIGHYKKKHIIKGILSGTVQTGFLLLLCQLFIGSPELASALGSQQASFHMGLVAFGILYSPVSIFTGIIMNYFSRKHEYEADAFATITFNGVALKNALVRLSTDNLSNLTPHPVYVFVHYSHPTLLQRIEAIDRIQAEK